MTQHDPFIVRPATVWDMDHCIRLVRDNWGTESADRCYEQFVEGLTGGKYDPVFYACISGLDKFAGFCAMQRAMRMHGGWDFIWVAVAKEFQGLGVGKHLTDYRLDRVREQDGSHVNLVTQKPKFFEKFGFITSQHLGNNWVEMCCQLKLVDMK
jgi:N-acetylglutamate synthase-like GNAT family acetyltransferase